MPEVASSIHFSNIQISYSEPLLKGVSATLYAGQLCALLGMNGAGKSTLLRIIAGVQDGWRGEVSVEGVARGEVRAMARVRAYMPQGGAPPFDYSALEVVMMGEHALRGRLSLPSASEAERARGYLARVELGHRADAPVTALSGGELQRVMLARVMATQARWWLLDEPLASLDLRHQVLVMRRVREHCARGGGALVTMHDLSWVERAFDRAIFLHQGHIVADGPPSGALREEELRAIFEAPLDAVHHDGGRSWVIAQNWT